MFQTDSEKLKERLNRIDDYNRKMGPVLIISAHDKLKADILKRVSGPYNPTGRGPGTGGEPIPRVSTRLFRSIASEIDKTKLVTKVFSRGSIAPHNVYVHFGTKRMRPRRFVEDSVDMLRGPILKDWEKRLKDGYKNA